ncbi:MAG TPA: diguanylate cyclase [Gemmatimonadales bacterium]|nr:diguanylate cyclase [Gemmatimonadales bacterium]
MPVPAADSASARLARAAHIQLSEIEAEQVWCEVSRHRRELLRRLGRDVGQRVALQDYLLNVRLQSEAMIALICDTAPLDAVERTAITDALTGLYDRGYFDYALKRELDRCARFGSTSSLLLLDLDEFQEINDQYGQRVGDKVLQAAASLIRKHARGADVPCRVAGDEFAIILYDTGREDAYAVAERLRADLEHWFDRNAVCGQYLEVTVRGGLATALADAPTHALLSLAAARAAEVAKARGGNCVVAATEPQLPEAAAAV